jgi:hypothetical protein
VAQVVEYLPSKHEALNSKSQYHQKKKKLQLPSAHTFELSTHLLARLVLALLNMGIFSGKKVRWIKGPKG